MADSYHIIDGQVVPYSGGRKCNDTDAWRDATPLELQLQEQLAESENAIATLQAEIEALRAEASTAHDAVLYHIAEHAKTRARAEQLAEVLRELVDLKDNVKHSSPNDYAVRKPLAWDKARALLRDQEEGSGAFWGPSPKVGGPDWTGYGG